MKSKTSSFNFTIIKKNFIKMWPIWGSLLFISLLAVYLTIRFSSMFIDQVELGDYIEGTIYQSLLPFSNYIYLIFAIIAAMSVNSYMFRTNSISFYHSLPYTRWQLYISNYISGMLALLVPLFISAIFAILYSASAYEVSFPGIFNWILYSILVALFYYSFATLCAVVTGQSAFQPICYFIFILYGTIMRFPIDSLMSSVLLGYKNDYRSVNKIGILNPAQYLNDFSDSYYFDTSRLHYFIVILISIAILFIVSYVIYRNRKSENSGDTIAIPWIKPIFIWTSSVTFSLIATWIFKEIVFDFSAYSTKLKIALLITFIIFLIIGFYAAAMIQDKSFRVIKKYLKQLSLCVVIFSVIFICFMIDIFGLQFKTPEENSIQSANLNVNYIYNSYNFKDTEDISKILSFHQEILDNKDELLVKYIDDKPNVWLNKVSLEFSYELKNGDTIYRTYNILYEDDSPSEKIINKILDYYNDNANYYLFNSSDPSEIINGAQINEYNIKDNNQLYYELDKHQAIELAKAIEKDIKEHNITIYEIRNTSGIDKYNPAQNTYNYSAVDDNYIHIDFDCKNYYDAYNLFINKNCTNVINYITTLDHE